MIVDIRAVKETYCKELLSRIFAEVQHTIHLRGSRKNIGGFKLMII